MGDKKLSLRIEQRVERTTPGDVRRLDIMELIEWVDDIEELESDLAKRDATIEELKVLLRYARRWISSSGIIDCQGSKCRQANCEACFYDPEDASDTTARIDAALAPGGAPDEGR